MSFWRFYDRYEVAVKVVICVIVSFAVPSVLRHFDPLPLDRPEDIIAVSQIQAEQSGGFVSLPISPRRGQIEFICKNAYTPTYGEDDNNVARVVRTAVNRWGVRDVTVGISIKQGIDGKQHTVITASRNGVL